jgi:hypothetical protein
MEKSCSSKLIVIQPIEKFPTFCEIVSYKSLYRSLFSPFHFLTLHFLNIHFIVIRYIRLCLPTGHLSSWVSIKIVYTFLTRVLNVLSSERKSKITITVFTFEKYSYRLHTQSDIKPVDNTYLIYAFSFYAIFSRNGTTK